MVYPTDGNKRIAKNTFFLYVRMLLVLLVTLYTTRVVLAQLGVDDYGVYMVVGGLVSMLTFLNGSMSTSTQRFLNYEMGSPEATSDKIRNVFSTSLTIHIIIALVVLVLAESVGLWFVNAKLVVPSESIRAANIVYQTTVASFCLSILQVPFNASIIAHERMQIYAYIGIIEVLLKLGIAWTLILIPSDRLGWYGVMILGVQVVVTCIYLCAALRNFPECTLRPSWIRPKLKEMASFAGWNMFGSIAWLVRGQGIGILLNVFWGPVLNAAKGISDQVASGVNSLASNFQVALNPQIVKNYANRDYVNMQLLTYRGIKFSCVLLWLMILTVAMNINPILNLWLEEIPEYSSLFIILILSDCFCGNLFGSPLMISLAATGNIRIYQIVVSSVLILVLPVGYYALRTGMPPQSIFYINIIFNLLAGLLRFWFCRRQLNYSFAFYAKYVLLPLIGLIIISLLVTLPVYIFLIDGIYNFWIALLVGVPTCMLSVCATAWLITLTKQERATICDIVKSKIRI